MTEEPYVDPGHRVPDEDWAAVVRRAKEIREQTQADAQGGASSGIAPVLDMTAKGLASGKYFPVSGVPTQLLVLHSAECPLAGGYAQSLTEWASSVYPADPVASWQRFIDPLVRLRFIPDELGAWHASEANPLSIGWEQAGYARYSRDQWLTPDGRTQLESLAFDMAEVAVRDGIPARWLSDQEVRAVLDGGNRSIKGFCFHRQIDPETRTDPGGGYPADLLMERIQFYMTGGLSAQSTTNTPAEQTKEWDDMASKEEIAEVVRQESGNYWFKNAYGADVQIWSILRAIDQHINGNNDSTQSKLDRLVGETVGLRAAVAALAAGSSVTPQQVEQAIKEALVGFSITLTSEGSKKEGTPANG